MRYDAARARFRGALAVELRVMGLTYSELAELLGYTHRSSARRAVMRTLKERADMAVDLYKVHRALDIDDSYRKAFPVALKGDARALSKCLRLSQEKLDLFG